MMGDGSAFSLISLFWCGDLMEVGLNLGLADMGISSFDVCLVVDDNFVVQLGPWPVWMSFPGFLCGGEKGLFFKEPFLFLLIFLSSKHYTEDMSLFLWLFLLIFSAFLFDFLGYQTQSNKITTFLKKIWKKK